ncbi:MAG: hypothetical protein SFU98_22150 [Leptospiraceae bacterium]|nr:hypothetical protein [Leptospiraceae bacterium]
MAKKKAPRKEKRPENPGFIDQFFLVVDHILSYFEVLFVYYRKKFNLGLKHTVLLLIAIFFTFGIFISGTGFLVHAGYISILQLLGGNLALTSFIVGAFLLTSSFVMLYFLIRKITL